MEVSNVNNGGMFNGMERLVGNNYKYWKMCMEAYLQGQDLWELVAGSDAIIPVETLEQGESRRKWKIKCGKALFALRTSISKEFIEHVRDLNSPKEVWDTLEKLFTKKNTARLQFLENELAISRQEGWSTQPSVEELENLLSNQEALAKQMVKGFENDAVLFSKGKNFKKGSSSKEKEEEQTSYKSNYEKKPPTCYKCGKVGHIKKYCRSKVTKANVACSSNDDDEVKWEQCFTVDTVVKKNQWIIDSGCSNHVTGNGTLLHDVRDHNQNRVVITAENSTHPVKKEGNAIIDVNNNTFALEDVYLIPELTKNLVSVPQITESGKYVLFGPTDVKVLENVKEIVGDVLFTGEKKGSLFVLFAGLLDLIHTDLMGPTKTPSYGGHCYVMVLIDDYSRFTWVKFLKEESEALSKFIEFKEAVESEFGRKGLPRELWAEALQCACHVSNRLPSRPVSSQFSESSKNGEENRDYKFMFPSFDTQEESENDGVSQNQEETPIEEVPTQVRRSTKEKRQPKHLSDYEVNTVTTCFFSGGLTEEPTCYEEAKDSPDWRKAMQEEIDALEKNETWELVKKPEACKPVTCKWVYRLKKNSKGTINKFKARIWGRLDVFLDWKSIN
ncbi:uncharacterized protein [Rutidosis leptorrhynchoides]|uniref:uncharacterized protein n=1 Tax=Rutidosis leptorrhynchoides TaxID=125765 RepID=UPI003A98E33C